MSNLPQDVLDKIDKAANEKYPRGYLTSVDGFRNMGFRQGAYFMYAEQQSAIQELCGVLEKVLPIAERMQAACESGESICYDNDYDHADAMYYLSQIEAAKQALQKHKQV